MILIEGPCHVSNIFPMSISSMLHVDFKKQLCCPVEFKGHGLPDLVQSRPTHGHSPGPLSTGGCRHSARRNGIGEMCPATHYTHAWVGTFLPVVAQTGYPIAQVL